VDAATAELLTDAVKILGPAIVTAVVAFKVARYQLEIERVKLFDKDRTEAYRRLLRFAHKLKNHTFPLAEDKRKEFKSIMEQDYFGSIEHDLIYFDDTSIKILDELDSRYVCMTHPDLIPEMDRDEEREFLEKKLFGLSEELASQVRKVMRKRRISA
jgi:hypothetical protein